MAINPDRAEPGVDETDEASGGFVSAIDFSFSYGLLPVSDEAVASPADRQPAFPADQDAGATPAPDAPDTRTTETAARDLAAEDQQAYLYVEPGTDLLPQDAQSDAVLNLNAFRADSRFAGIDGSGYSVVIIDTGINYSHPYFSGHIAYSYDFYGSNDADATDYGGHGSNVASIAAGSIGVAPGANIIALKVFPDGGGGAWYSDIEEALQWVINNGAAYNVVSVNLSLGSGVNYTTASTHWYLGNEFQALANQGIVTVAAAGNSYYSYQTQGASDIAADPNVIGVGAVYDGNSGGWSYGSGAIAYSTTADQITPFSQRSTTLVDIFAPGAPITGAGASGSSTVTMHGTSQATPQIAGIAALAQELAVQTIGRKLTVAEFTSLLKSSGTMIYDGDNENDNVANTNTYYKRADVAALGQAILALDVASTLVGTAGADTLTAVRKSVMSGLDGNDTLYGSSAADTIDGGNGDDLIVSGGGLDTLIGGTGNDTFVLNDSVGAIIENVGGGTDIMLSAVSVGIRSNIEALMLVGGADINAAGYEANDTLIGNSGSNSLNGGSGADVMEGGGGNDFYFVDNAGDAVVEEPSAPFTPPAGYAITGTADFNGDGELDVLVSSSTANYIWLLKNAGVISATALPYASGWTVGVADLDGDGDKDILYQSGGTQVALYLSGTTELGRTIVSGKTADPILPLPAGNSGIDTVYATISYALPTDVENLNLFSGSGNLIGTGNALANAIAGNNSANTLTGGGGGDTLTGYGGADVFVYDDGDSTAAARDLITDFTPGSDKLDLVAIDGNTLAGGDDPFRWLGSANLDGVAGALRQTYVAGSNLTLIEGDANGDGTADVVIALAGNKSLSVSDFASGSVTWAVTAAGTAGADVLAGTGGNDTLDGLAGADTMLAGLGDDTYYVDDSGDRVIEASAAAFSVPAGWTIHGTADIDFDGDLDVLVSSASANQIWLLQNGTISSAVNHAFAAGWTVGLADLDGDGDKDILYQNGGTQVALYLAGTAEVGRTIVSGRTADPILPLPASNEGTDTVVSSVSYTMPDGIENLVLAAGAGALSGTGNALSNSITGNESDNVLSGGGGDDVLSGGLGADTMTGGTGNDTFYVDSAGDVVNESAGTAYSPPAGWTIRGTADLDGDGDLDVLASSASANQIWLLQNGTVSSAVNHAFAAGWTVGLADLDGDGDKDILYQNGGTQVALYLAGTTEVGRTIVSGRTADPILPLPASSEGTDTVVSSVSYTMPDNVDHLVLAAGTGALSGTGNALSNSITGNESDNVLSGGGGDDVLFGGLGADTMTGGTGNDTFYVDSAGDVVNESAGTA
ncbi:MAG: S8 family serine peptidase, partial [Alphaproteobacteria bacterium]|nr:S8 family serine peptidase [Alphaproteobacteria bacterium]